MMNVSRSAYYAWLTRPAKLISAEQLHLYRRAKVIFERSRNSLGYRELRKRLCGEGFKVSDYGVQKLMAKLGLVVTQRVAYKVTTKRKHSDAVADNLLNQNFNPIAPYQVWAGDVTYLRTGESWMYLAIVMDLYSRRIIGWHIDKRMTTDLVSKAMIKLIICVSQLKAWYFIVTEVHNIPVNNTDDYYGVMVLEPVWAMSVRVGIMLLSSASLVA